MADEKNYFKELYDVNVNDHVEKKNGLYYLSWPWAWAEIKKRYPDATYTIYENADGWNYFTDGRTCWVKTGATVNGIEYIEYLPVMDYRNKSIPVKDVTSFDVNKTIQRSLTKALARHGLGLYIFSGEDLPEDAAKAEAAAREAEREAKKAESVIVCESCGNPIKASHGLSVEKIVAGSMKSYGKKLCFDCAMKAKKEKEEKEEQQ